VVVVVAVVMVAVVVVDVVAIAVVILKYKSLEMDFSSADSICESLGSHWGGYVCAINAFL
jgi:hypothetical protein